jgi:hypothetical protein
MGAPASTTLEIWRVIVSAKYGQKILHFYCFKCKAYELKTSPHYRAQKQRFARRRKKETVEAIEAEQPQSSGK